MSGHSKWKNIMHKKGKTDAQRAKIFTKMSREISVAVKESGPDPNANSRLKDIIAKARANNVPSDNIERVIKKASGAENVANYEQNVYEGYGPSGVAVLVETLTDNKNRTAADLRHYFDKFGGNLGTSGSVAWQFQQKGILIVSAEKYGEDSVMACALDAGAEDFETGDGVYEITTPPADFYAVKTALEDAGFELLSAELDRIPDTYVALLDPDDIKKMNLLLDSLEDHDDVQNVYHNWENAGE